MLLRDNADYYNIIILSATLEISTENLSFNLHVTLLTEPQYLSMNSQSAYRFTYTLDKNVYNMYYCTAEVWTGVA